MAPEGSAASRWHNLATKGGAPDGHQARRPLAILIVDSTNNQSNIRDGYAVPVSTGPAEQPETIETDPHVELLLAPFDDDQQYLVDQVALLYAQSGKWPVFEYIEQLLAKRRLDPLVVLASFPWIKSARAHPVWEYWPVFYGRFVSPSPESTVQLTVLGLAKATLQLDTVGSFLKVLSILADARATWPLDPYSVTKPLLPVNSLWTGTIPPVVPERVLALLPRELAGLSGLAPGEAQSWLLSKGFSLGWVYYLTQVRRPVRVTARATWSIAWKG